MRILKWVVLSLIALIAILLVIGFFLPAEFGMQRSTVVDAPPEVIYEHIVNLRKNEAWSPWQQMDPTIATTYNDVERGVGASYSWTSENSGAGTYNLVETDPPLHARYEIVFEGQGDAGGEWILEPAGDGTKVTWTFEGDAGGNPIGRWSGLMIDTFLGQPYELGLASLKREAEATPIPEPPAPESDVAMDGAMADDSTN